MKKNRTWTAVPAVLAVALVGLAGSARAQVVIQSEAQTGGEYGEGAYAEPAPQPYAQPAQPSPYVAGSTPPPRPAQVVVHRSPTMALVVPGAIALGAGFLISGIGSAYVSTVCGRDCPGPDLEGWTGYSWIPLVGPWVAYAETDNLAGYEWLHFVSGILQGGGLIALILGLAIQQEWEEATYADLGEGRRLSFDVGVGSSSLRLAF